MRCPTKQHQKDVVFRIMFYQNIFYLYIVHPHIYLLKIAQILHVIIQYSRACCTI